MKKNSILISAVIVLSIVFMGNSNKPMLEKYKDPSAPIEERVEDLLSKLTLEEKIDLLGGTGFATKPNTRLGIPELRMVDGPIGVRMGKAVSFPSGIAMASTWNPALIGKVGAAIGREVKAKDQHVILGPCVNIARIPQGGRNFESFGEDPFLASRMTVDYIKGVQSENVVATVKHFACNNQEYERMYVDTQIDERSLNEIYLPAFKAAVQEADVLALMNAYNKVNGHYCAENDHLLIDILKKEWGFKGLVMSDWGAVHSSIPTANSGMDLEMPTGQYLNPETLLDAVIKDIVPVSKINDKVRRILRVMFKLGLFENPSLKGNFTTGSKENIDAAYKAELEGIVLLQNKNNILPLKLDKIKSLAIVGPNSISAKTGGGGSSRVDPTNAPSPLEYFKKELDGKVKINFAQGLRMAGETDPIPSENLFTDNGENGLSGEYFDNKEFKGSPAFTRIDKEIDFNWGDGSPMEGFKKNEFSVRWSGKLKAPRTGNFVIETLSDDGIRLFINDKLMFENWDDHAPEPNSTEMKLEKDKLYNIKIEYYENGGGAVAKLGWETPGDNLMKDAITAAKNSDAVLVFVGTSENIESEGFDRDNIALPEGQDKLIKEISKINKNVIVVISSGSPVLMNSWISNVNGIIETWFGGQEMSRALYDIVVGNYNPSGKLPVSFPKKWEDCSAYNLYKVKDSITVYSDGIYVGYRHFDKKKTEPLFPFGYGLSYTTFTYKDLKLTKDGELVKASFSITNSGKLKGAEVAQLYVNDVKSNVDRPEKELKGFKKVELNPGETKTVEIVLDKNSFSYFDPSSKKWTMEPGDFVIQIGASSKDIKLKDKITL